MNDKDFVWKHNLRELLPVSLFVTIGFFIFFTFHPEYHVDLVGYRDPAISNQYYHPYWARWFFTFLTLLPFQLSYIFLGVTTIAGLYFSVRAFGGQPWLVFTSYQIGWLFFYGQIDGLIISSLAFAWWATERQRPFLAGLGLAFAMVKPQVSIFLIILFWWWSSSRWKTSIFPACLILLSFIQWGFWLPEWIGRIFQFKEIYDPSATNISLWQQLGVWSLLIWPLIFLIPLDRKRRIVAVSAGTMISVPYFPIYSSLLVLPMPIPVFTYALFQTSFLLPIIGPDIFTWLKAVPVILLLWTILPSLRSCLKIRQIEQSRANYPDDQITNSILD
jgi:hypothetical protein